MSDLEYHKLEKENGVARITLNRPKVNVFDINMMKEFNTIFEDLSKDDDLKCVVIFGEGPAWCAGVEVGDHKPESAGGMIDVFNRQLALIMELEVPTIAAVHGVCLGGGMEVAIACDIVMASEKAKFGQPEIKLGFLPPYAVVRLPELVGSAKAIEICTSGKIYSAEESRRLGFVSQVAPADEFAEAVEKMIQEIAYNSPLIIRMNKKAVIECRKRDHQAAVEWVSDYFLNTLMKSNDTLEGIASFEEKRKPVWKNS